MKIGSTDPRVIATVIIVNHGTSLTRTEVEDVVIEAFGPDDAPSVRVCDDVWDLIQDATVTVTWDDAGDEPCMFPLCSSDCCMREQ